MEWNFYTVQVDSTGLTNTMVWADFIDKKRDYSVA